MTHKGTREIRTERLLLRKIRLSDAEDVFRWMGDPAVCKYERWAPHPSAKYTRGYILEVFGDYPYENTYWWGIEFEGKLIGMISVVHVDDFDQKAVLGYCLAKAFWSRGFATEAAKAVLDYMFEEIGLHRIEASHAVQNVASGRVLEKLGMQLEGVAKDYYYSNSGFHDSQLFGITRKQYLLQI